MNDTLQNVSVQNVHVTRKISMHRNSSYIIVK
jgi:hypothetical protein